MNNKLLKLFYLVSPSLPIGAYAYSQGLEYAIDGGWIKVKKNGSVQNCDLVDWLRGVMTYGVGRLDLPLMIRCKQALDSNDFQTYSYWNDWALASRETSELLLEDTQLGLALQRLLKSLEVSDHGFHLQEPSYLSQFTLAAHRWNIKDDEALPAYLWSWLENQVAAATKIVPLGQTHAQKILIELMEDIPSVCEHAKNIENIDLGVSLPGVCMASASHEFQYSRLFRS